MALAIAAAVGCVLNDCRPGAAAAGSLAGRLAGMPLALGPPAAQTLLRSAANTSATGSVACCAPTEGAASAAASAVASMA
jgi:hypothetical protein